MTTPSTGLRYLVTMGVEVKDGNTARLPKLYQELVRNGFITEDADYNSWRTAPTALCNHLNTAELEARLLEYNSSQNHVTVVINGVTPTTEDGRGVIQCVFYTYPIYDISAITTIIGWLRDSPPPDFR